MKKPNEHDDECDCHDCRKWAEYFTRKSVDFCVGDGELFWEFFTGEERDAAWDNLVSTHGWKSEWAEKRGDGKGRRSHIVFHPELIDQCYRFRMLFR